MDKIKFTRKELHDLVWTEPLSRLAKRYQISDNGLRKKCKKANIPLPPMGYWQKLKYNKPVPKKTTLKKQANSETIYLVDRDDEDDGKVTRASRVKAIIKEYESMNPSIFRVPSRLTKPDELVIEAQKTLTKQSTSEWSHWLINTRMDEINIKIAPENTGRALRFFDAIIKLLKRNGHDVKTNGSETYAVINEENILISLRERLRIEKTVEKNGRNTNKYFPTGKLVFSIGDSYRTKEFVDTKTLIEDKLVAILAELAIRSQIKKEYRIEAEINRVKREAQKRIEKEFQERKSKELKNFKLLINEADRWHQSRILRDYIAYIQNQDSVILDKDENWINWAQNKIDWYDPLIHKKDDLLNDNDRLKISAELSSDKEKFQTFSSYY